MPSSLCESNEWNLVCGVSIPTYQVTICEGDGLNLKKKSFLLTTLMSMFLAQKFCQTKIQTQVFPLFWLSTKSTDMYIADIF